MNQSVVPAGKDFAILLAIIVGGVVLRLFNLTDSPFWHDEAASLYLASHFSIPELLELGGRDTSPPLANVIYRLWYVVAGQDDFFLELFSVLWGALSIVAIYFLGTQLFDRSLGLLAAFLLALSPHHLYFSQQVRIYSLLLFVLIVCGFLTARASCDGRPAVRRAFLLSAVLLCHLHYLMIFTVPVLWVATMLFLKKDSWRIFFIESAVAALFTLPVGYWLAEQVFVAQHTSWIPPFQLPFLLVGWLSTFPGERLLNFAPQLSEFASVWVSAAVLFFLIRFPQREDNRKQWTLVVWCFLPIFLQVLVSIFFSPIYYPRYQILVLVPFVLMAAAGISELPSGWLRAGFVIVLLAFLAPLYPRYFSMQSQRAVEREVFSFLLSQDPPPPVIIHSAEHSFLPSRYYAPSIRGCVVSVNSVISAWGKESVSCSGKSFLHDSSLPVWGVDFEQERSRIESFFLKQGKKIEEAKEFFDGKLLKYTLVSNSSTGDDAKVPRE